MTSLFSLCLSQSKLFFFYCFSSCWVSLRVVIIISLCKVLWKRWSTFIGISEYFPQKPSSGSFWTFCFSPVASGFGVCKCQKEGESRLPWLLELDWNICIFRVFLFWDCLFVLLSFWLAVGRKGELEGWRLTQWMVSWRSAQWVVVSGLHNSARQEKFYIISALILRKQKEKDVKFLENATFWMYSECLVEWRKNLHIEIQQHLMSASVCRAFHRQFVYKLTFSSFCNCIWSCIQLASFSVV